MYLTEEQVKSITRGTVDIELKDGKYNFYRFSKFQMDVYKETILQFYNKSFATSCVCLDFYTDADDFGFHFDITSASSRSFYYFDVYVDGVMVKHLGEANMWIMGGDLSLNITADAQPERLTAAGTGEKLKEGYHHITVWLPNLVCARLSDIRISDGADIIPTQYDMKLLIMGDSITQGYDAQFPSLAYTNRVARHFNAYAVNQAIGGEKFAPQIIDKNLSFKPDAVLIAYGSNDWSMWTRENFETGCDKFVSEIAELYPDIPKFGILPIWRGDNARIPKNYGGTFGEAGEYIRKRELEYGFNVIEGWNIIPHYPEFFGDLRLHPNDLGFGEYAKKVISEMEKVLGKRAN